MITVDFKGKKALVTGGASGIGLAVVEALLRCGATVAVNYLPADAKAPAVIEGLAKGKGAGHNSGVIAAPGDVSDAQDAARMVAKAIADLQGLDILINNAGTPATVEPIPFENFDAMTEEKWESILSTNLIGPFRCAKAASAALRNSKGVIINTASIAGLGGQGSSIAYAASKAGLINLTRNLAKAFGPDVRVNAVAPGLTRTPWTDPWPAERKARSVENTALKKLVEPSDIANAMIFLAAHTAITGQTLVVDCGRNL
jgi:3-oxoacyl-[acyl-carrier protein] reductase